MFMQSREAVRVKVKKFDGKQIPELQKFSVDPQITSLEVLQSILVKAFNLKGDFSLSYKSVDDSGQEDYVALLSDWDLDAAFLRAQNTSSLQGTEPCVHLRVDVKSVHEYSGDSENEGQINISRRLSQKNCREPTNIPVANSHQENSENKPTQSVFQGIFMNQMEKTLNLVSRALNLSEDPNIPMRQPLCDAEFRSFLDPVGQVVQGAKLREVIYCGGIDPSLRRVVWKHILNVYPDGMSGKQRMDYMKKKSSEYFMLRDVWRDCIQKGQVSSDLAYVTSMVKKDVLRTDRHHKFYAGSDDNQNIASLFNILTTYALNHPLVSYCQGMSDLASPLLVTMGDEAHAYICLCALMTRLYPNFLLDGEAMTLKFTHLTESLQVYDSQFYTYLKNQQADDLLFCYRWLLLEMKREFAFEDSLHMLEVLWSSLPPRPPAKELSLKEKVFCPNLVSESLNETPLSPLVKAPRENAYTKLCAMRRQNSSTSLAAAAKTKIKSYKRMNHSLDENIGKKSTSPTSLQLSKEFQSMDDAAINLKLCSSPHSRSDHIRNTSNSSSYSLPEYHQFFSNQVETSPQNEMMHSDKESPKNAVVKPTDLHLSNGNESTQNNVTVTNSPIKIIENFNEFKNLSCQRKKVSNTTFKYNSFNDSKVLNKSDGTHEIEQHVNILDNTLKESEYEDSSPDDSKDYAPMTTSMTRELKLESENFDKVLCHQCMKKEPFQVDLKLIPNDSGYKCSNFECEYRVEEKLSFENIDSHTSTDITTFSEKTSVFQKVSEKNNDDVFVWENPLHDNIPSLQEIKLRSEPLNGTMPKNKLNDLIHSESDELVENISNNKHAFQINDRSSNDKNENSKSLPRNNKSNSKFFSNMSQELENARRNCEVLLSNKKTSNLHSIAATISNFQKKYDIQPQTSNSINDYSTGRFHNVGSMVCEEISESSEIKQLTSLLPPPNLFGGGNPFLMFLCLTVLMQHRDYIMRNHMDYNELAMHFDKMVRKHNVYRVLNQARRMYSQYLKNQNEHIDL